MNKVNIKDSQNFITSKNIHLGTGTEWVAGRDSACEVVIDDQRVSRRQFKIIKEDEVYYLVDIGSVNGTLLNNKNVVPHEKVKLKSGDKIQVLDNILVFELKNAAFEKNLMALTVSDANAGTSDVNNTLMPFGTQVPTVQAQLPNLTPQYNQDPSAYPQVIHPGQDPMSGVTPYQAHYPMSSDYNSLPPDFSQHYSESFSLDTQKNQEEEKNKKIRLALVAAVILVIGLFIFNEQKQPENKKMAKSSDPFAKVDPNIISLLKQSKDIANDYYFKKKYRLAQEEAQKILKKFEELNVEYKKTKFGMDVEELDKKSSLAIAAESEYELFLKAEQEKKSNEEKLQAGVQLCEAKLNKNPQMTAAEYDSCIAPVIHYNPSHPGIQMAKLKIQQALDDKNRRELEQKNYRENVAKLQSIYNKAVKTEKDGSYLDAIEDYRVVLKQHLPDPQDLKVISKRKIAAIEKMISSKSVTYLNEADALAREKKYKEAIYKLKTAMKVNPGDPTLETKISGYKRELAKEIRPIWEEATIEETYSQVECTENKSCALEKWKKILQMDVPDGEYFQKAQAKLKKYGAH